jgi:hypothetical protein
MQPGGEWEAFLSRLQPGTGLVEKLDAYRFSGEPEQAETNSQQTISTPPPIHVNF